MGRKEIEEQVIKNYERDEQMMVFIFAQWCVNNELDPSVLYKQAYPQQSANEALRQAIQLTVPKEEAGPISDETLLNILALYGNDELAFVAAKEIERR